MQSAKNKQTNARKAHRPAPSSPSEVITMLKGIKTHVEKKQGNTIKHEVARSINHKATQNKNYDDSYRNQKFKNQFRRSKLCAFLCNIIQKCKNIWYNSITIAEW